jgi:hypothetical protein
VNNGLTLSSLSEIINHNPISSPAVLDTSVFAITGPGSIKLAMSTSLASPNGFGDVALSYIINHGSVLTSLVSGTTYPTVCTVSSSPSSISPFVETLGWGKTGEEFAGWDYSHQCSGTDASITIGSIYPWLTASDGGSWASHWTRARTYPPNEVMPSATLGTVVSNGFTQVGSLTLNTGESALRSAVIDPASGYAYFGTNTAPGVVVKVRLSDFTRVGNLTLNTGENELDSAVIDSANGYAYFGTGTFPGIVVKVRLSDFSRVGALRLNVGGKTDQYPL